ncbi:hypothetical protein F53441_9597 [Fusarium austroafricanum]|uniref:Uncharacterized protein n=1 Tax=Fusarium austroafricanum TaxID=2364996 RepID=A0A8H4KBF4_9HYPO|nr:hypothetical protein F53441_9597 [Fusarium austroafricanum]
MSTNELPQRSKRKHSEDETEDDIVQNLCRWKKRELSPESSTQAEILLEAAAESPDNSLLLSSIDFFEAKQKQKEEAKRNSTALATKVQDLEAQLQQVKAQLEESQDAERKAQAEYSDLLFMIEYGDWFRLLLSAIRFQESGVCKADVVIFKAQYLDEWEVHRDAVEAAGKAQAEAEGVPYHGPSEEQKRILGEEKRNVQKRAEATARLDCLNGERHTTSARDMIEAEKQAILDWRESGQNESTAPGTPFLDRIQRMCDKAGVTRLQCLDWINQYAERNETCHNPPPRVSMFWMKDASGQDVEVDHPKNAHTAIDWAAMKAAVDNYKAEIDSNDSLSEERRAYIIELIDDYWKFHLMAQIQQEIPFPQPLRKRKLRTMPMGEPKRDLTHHRTI